MSSDSEDYKLVITDIKSEVEAEPDEEELLDLSRCSDLDDILSVGTSELGELLDSDFDGSGHSSQSQMKQVLKPSQKNPITAPRLHKQSIITPITAPKSLSTPAPLSSSCLSLKGKKVIKIAPKKILNSTRLATVSSNLKKPSSVQKQAPVGVPGVVKVKPSQSSPVKAPDNSHHLKSLSTSSSNSLQQGDIFCNDFVFIKHESSPLVVSSSDEDSGLDGPPVLGAGGGMDDVLPDFCNKKDSVSMKPSPLLLKVETLPQSSCADSNPFKDAAHTKNENTLCVNKDTLILPWGPPAQIVPHDHAPNPFLSQPESTVSMPQRQVTYCDSATLPGAPSTQEEQTGLRRKPTIIKLNKTKVFRYVPEELPGVELPDLATRKWTTRKRVNSYRGDDCPDLLLETKRHVEEGDLRSVLTAQRSNRLSSISEVSSTSESQNKYTRIVTSYDTSSHARLDPELAELSQSFPSVSTAPSVQEAHTRSMRTVSEKCLSSTFEIEPHIDHPVILPIKSDYPVVTSNSNIQKDKSFSSGRPGRLHPQTKKFCSSSTDSSSDPGKTTAYTSLSDDSQSPKKNVFTNCAFSPVKDSSVDVRKPSPIKCVSIFARRPNLMSRNLGVSRFSLRHLDNPGYRPFALDHL